MLKVGRAGESNGRGWVMEGEMGTTVTEQE